MKHMAIHNYRAVYTIFENGVIKSNVNNNILKPIVNSNGYLKVVLSGKQLSVHRLVAQHFIANPYNYPQVNHIDGNKENNHANNLEWCTALDNIHHALETGLRKGFVPYDTKLKLMYRAIEGELIADLQRELPDTHPNTLSKMLRSTAEKEGLTFEWKSAMKERRRNVAIANLPS